MNKDSCQCCMMPFRSDPGHRTSQRYCSFCFRDGTLNADGVSLRDFQRCSYRGMRERGMSPVTARFFAFSLRFSPYWKGRAAGKPAQ